MARRRALTDNEIRQYLEDHFLSPTESGDEDGNSATENSDSEEEYMPPNNAESDNGESSNPDDPSVDLDKEWKCFMLNISISPNKNPPAAKCFSEKSTKCEVGCEVLFRKIHQVRSGFPKNPPTAIYSHCSWWVFESSTLQLVDFSIQHFAVGGFSLGGVDFLIQ